MASVSRPQAAALFAESRSSGLTNPFCLSVTVPPDTNISDGCKDPVHTRVSTPAKPVFKPDRPYVTEQKLPNDDPFSPILPLRNKGRAFNRLASRISFAGDVAPPRAASPESFAITSRRSMSPSRAGSITGIRSSLAAQELAASLGARVNHLEEELESAQDEVRRLRQEMAARQESYIRREDDLKDTMTKMQEELDIARGERSVTADTRFGGNTKTIMGLRDQVAHEMEELLTQQEAAIKHQEHNQSRKLKNRLAEVEAELAAQRAALEGHESTWLDKSYALRHQLEVVQAAAVKLDDKYKSNQEECTRLRADFKCQEEDRQTLVRQVVGLKRERQRLSSELEAARSTIAILEQERDDAVSALGSMGPNTSDTGATGHHGDAVQIKVQRYEGVIDSLKKLCEAERKRCKQAKAALNAELANRSQLHVVLQQLIQDVRDKQHQAPQETSPATHRARASSAYGTAASKMNGTSNQEQDEFVQEVGDSEGLDMHVPPSFHVHIGSRYTVTPTTQTRQRPASACAPIPRPRPMSAASAAFARSGSLSGSSGPMLPGWGSRKRPESATGTCTLPSSRPVSASAKPTQPVASRGMMSNGAANISTDMTPAMRQDLLAALSRQEHVLTQLMQCMSSASATCSATAGDQAHRDTQQTTVLSMRTSSQHEAPGSDSVDARVHANEIVVQKRTVNQSKSRPWSASVGAIHAEFLSGTKAE